MSDDRPWWKKPPRSSRICYRCHHKYSSHISERCLKIIERKPERKECSCKGFIKNSQEYDMELEKENRKNALKAQTEQT